MIDAASCFQSTISLGHLPRSLRIALLKGLCRAIRADLQKHGPNSQLTMIGVGLDYCASLLADAGEDGSADAVDAALAQLDEEVRLLTAILRAALHRPDEPSLQKAAAQLLAILFPSAGLQDSVSAAQVLLRMAQPAEAQHALDRLGCLPVLRRIERAVQMAHVDGSGYQGGDLAEELRARARNATRYADGLLRRMLGHISAVMDPADEALCARAGLLLSPLEEVLAATGAIAAAPSRPSLTPGRRHVA